MVGDPKQSIYRFRRADIAVYLGAAARIDAEEVALSANFRSTGAVIDWVNGVFADVIRPEPDVQPAYRALEVARAGSTAHGTVTVLGDDVHDAGLDADALRWCEARRRGRGRGHGPARGLAGRRRRRRAAPVPARRHRRAAAGPDVAADAGALAGRSRRAVPGRERLRRLPGARDPPRHAGAAGRRRPDRRTGPRRRAAQPAVRLQRRRPLRLAPGRRTLEPVRRRAARPDGGPSPTASPTCARSPNEPAASGRRTSSTRSSSNGGCSRSRWPGPDARDVWRRVRFVVDQARAWTEAGGRGLRRYLRWTRFQASEGRASDTILPERDHDAVRIMTVHAAKGLEFPVTVVAGLTTPQPGSPVDVGRLADRDVDAGRARQPAVRVVPAPGRADGRRRAPPPAVRRLHPRRRPPRRVAPPQARDASPRSTAPARGPAPRVLAAAGADGHGAVVVRRVGGAAGPDAGERRWSCRGPIRRRGPRNAPGPCGRRRCARRRAPPVLAAAMPLADRRRRAGAAATHRPVALADDSDLLALAVDAGLAKDPVDLDLPPWQRGRYGTAIGRAVHAVLQDADLDDGHDIDHLAAAHAAAEGIFGLESTVAALSRSALGAPDRPGRRRRRRPLARAVRRRRARRAPCSRATSTSSCARRTASSSSTTRPTTSAARATGPSAWPATASSSPRTASPSARSSTSRSSAGSSCTAAPDGPAEQLDVPDWPGALAAVRAATLVLH